MQPCSHGLGLPTLSQSSSIVGYELRREDEEERRREETVEAERRREDFCCDWSRRPEDERRREDECHSSSISCARRRWPDEFGGQGEQIKAGMPVCRGEEREDARIRSTGWRCSRSRAGCRSPGR